MTIKSVVDLISLFAVLYLVFVRFKGPGDDLICPKRLNVPTGLVFKEGGESSLELLFVC